MTTYLLRQTFRYEYPGPIRDLHHRLMVVPPRQHGEQFRRNHVFAVRGAEVTVAEGEDRFGNHRYEVRTARVEEAIEFASSVTVERSTATEAARFPASALTDPHLRLPSVLTQPDDALASAARRLSGPAAPEALAEGIASWVHGVMCYRHGTTHVRTTAAQALAAGAGVCQDYAHVMIAVARRCGLAARYVSGHLVGEGGSHAWVEVIVPDETAPGRARALAYDPTNDCRAGDDYITVAVGRDYHDVAPTAGTFCAGWAGSLTWTKTLEAAVRA